MASLTIHDLDDGTYDRLRAHATAMGRSPEDEVRQMIEDRVKLSRAGWVEELRTLRQRLHEDYGPLPDSVTLVRQVRDRE